MFYSMLMSMGRKLARVFGVTNWTGSSQAAQREGEWRSPYGGGDSGLVGVLLHWMGLCRFKSSGAGDSFGRSGRGYRTPYALVTDDLPRMRESLK